jgi:ComEC/Rec2-related protein
MRLPIIYLLIPYIFIILIIENKLINTQIMKGFFYVSPLLCIFIFIKFKKLRILAIFSLIAGINLFFKYDLEDIVINEYYPKREITVTVAFDQIKKLNDDLYYTGVIIDANINKELLMNRYFFSKIKNFESYKVIDKLVLMKGLIDYKNINGYQEIFIDRCKVLKFIKNDILFNRLIESIKNYINNVLESSSKLDSNLVGFQKGIFLGDTECISKKIYDNFRFSGTLHLFAVSGLHIGFIYIIFKKVFSIIWIRGFLSECIITLILIVYLYVVEHPPSAVRAIMMIISWQISLILYKKKNPISSLLLSCFIVLLINPRFLTNIGFQLSYTVVLSILIFTWRSNNNGLFKNSLSVSYAAFCGSFLLIFDYFHIIVPGSILINILLIPPVFIIITTIFVNLILNINFINYIVLYNYDIIIFITKNLSYKGITYFGFFNDIVLHNFVHIMYPLSFFFYFSRFNKFLPKYLSYFLIPVLHLIIFTLLFT